MGLFQAGGGGDLYVMNPSFQGNLNLADSSSGEAIFLGERLLQLQNNPIDVLSLVNNATGLNVQGLCSSFDELRTNST